MYEVSSKKIKCLTLYLSIMDFISWATNFGERFLNLFPKTFVLQKIHLKGHPLTVIMGAKFLIPCKVPILYLSIFNKCLAGRGKESIS